MVDFLTAAKARGEVEGIISKARANDRVVMISPYIKVSEELISRLADAGRQKVVIVMVCRREDLKKGERERLEQIPGLQLYFHERVHAKCFYDEETMVITSLNLYDSSLGDNREMGVRLRHSMEGDRQAFEDAKREAQFTIRECQGDRPPTVSGTGGKSRTSSADVG